MAPMSANESSLSLEGVGSVVRALGGGRFFLGRPKAPPDADESGLGPSDDAARELYPPRGPAAEPARGRPPPGMLIPPTEP